MLINLNICVKLRSYPKRDCGYQNVHVIFCFEGLWYLVFTLSLIDWSDADIPSLISLDRLGNFAFDNRLSLIFNVKAWLWVLTKCHNTPHFYSSHRVLVFILTFISKFMTSTLILEALQPYLYEHLGEDWLK
jgi:hypothetical protein